MPTITTNRISGAITDGTTKRFTHQLDSVDNFLLLEDCYNLLIEGDETVLGFNYSLLLEGDANTVNAYQTARISGAITETTTKRVPTV